MVSTADIVKEYLGKNPEIGNHIDMGIVNTSALARLIMKESNINDFDATVAAIKRYKRVSGRVPQSYVLDRSNLEMSANVSIISIKKSYVNLKIVSNIINNSKKLNSISFLEDDKGLTLIGDSESISAIWNSFPSDQILDMSGGLGELTIISPDEIGQTRGYVYFITALLYRAGINILHILSFYNNTLIILNESDLTVAFSVISSKIMEQ
ncbi:MAG: hypothetical protein QXZ44_04650 [Ferroplasma sp.]